MLRVASVLLSNAARTKEATMLVPLLEALLALLTRPGPVPVPCPVSNDDKKEGQRRKRSD